MTRNSLCVVIITKNSSDILDGCLKSVSGLKSDVVLVDDYSTDKTVTIAKKHKVKVIKHHEANFGKQKAFALNQAKGEWILSLDSDERLTKPLVNEILFTIKREESDVTAYRIPYQNHFLGKKINYGGEDYKMIRLFKKEASEYKDSLVHEKIEIKKGQIGVLKNKINHYSYRSIGQMFNKFTDYAKRDVQTKINNREKSSLKKIILYPLHMFWARFFKDKGYKDGLFRIPLDLGFAYMEFLTYFLLLFKRK